MIIVALAWMYVVLMMAVAEALSTQGTLIGAFFTLLLYGLLPLGIVLYIGGTPGRKRLRKAREAQAEAQARAEAVAQAPAQAAPDSVTSAAPDGSGHAPGAPVAAERKET